MSNVLLLGRCVNFQLQLVSVYLVGFRGTPHRGLCPYALLGDEVPIPSVPTLPPNSGYVTAFSKTTGTERGVSVGTCLVGLWYLVIIDCGSVAETIERSTGQHHSLLFIISAASQLRLCVDPATSQYALLTSYIYHDTICAENASLGHVMEIWVMS